MPRNTSSWTDLKIHLLILAFLIVVVMKYNVYAAAIGFVLLGALYVYGRERCRDRQKDLDSYLESVVSNLNDISNFAMEKLPMAILVLNRDTRILWCNREMGRWFGRRPEIGTPLGNFWQDFDLAEIWGEDGEIVFHHNERYFRVKHRVIINKRDEENLMALYITDVTEFETMRLKEHESNKAFCYIQIDNYDEVFQGMSETQQTDLLVKINRELDAWSKSVDGYLRRVTQDLYLAVLDRKGLEVAVKDRFEILDQIRNISAANRFPVTLSMGISVAEDKSFSELAEEAKAGLDLALGRGGDQVAAAIDGKTQFFGGKAKAVEKHTRVKSRVVSHALHEIIEVADLVLIMGHHNEDFDSFGAAVGVAKMARFLNKKVKIVLSDVTGGIDKVLEMLKEHPEYKELFVRANNVLLGDAMNPVLFIVDTHVPNMTADKSLLDKVENKIIIDHHRRSENFVENPLLVYMEPSASSTSELVTELLIYFDDDMTVDKLDATVLYAGIVVDTKYFSVQTGVRTFDAAAYLRRCGADPAEVRYLFKVDYESVKIKADILSRAEFFYGGLMVSDCPSNIANVHIMAAQVADSMLRVEDVRMSVVLFKYSESLVGVSARSNGEINVQLIMEHFGGGGHQNVAGAQVADTTIEKLKQDIIDYSVKFIKEIDTK
jgi:c-di-AMP phosphodiesterase-like protein